LIDRLLPPEILDTPESFASSHAYQDWHVLRRVGSLGLAQTNTSEYWSGILGVKSAQRRTILNRLTEQQKVVPLAIEDYPIEPLFIRSADMPTLDSIQKQPEPQPVMALIAPLDNLIWNRGLIDKLFDFQYTWEVYKPKATREYGYYVLPVLYGDRFIARLDPAFDKKKRTLTIQNWWWEADVGKSAEMHVALRDCFARFLRYLGTDRIDIDKILVKREGLGWLLE